MMTQTPYSWKSMLLTLTTATALLFAAPNVHAQTCDDALTEMEAALTEVEAVNADVVSQRNRAIAQAEADRKSRDECEGAHGEVSAAAAGLRVTVRDYERTIARYEARPRPIVYYVAGVVTPLLLTGLGVLVYFAAR